MLPPWHEGHDRLARPRAAGVGFPVAGYRHEREPMAGRARRLGLSLRRQIHGLQAAEPYLALHPGCRPPCSLGAPRGGRAARAAVGEVTPAGWELVPEVAGSASTVSNCAPRDDNIMFRRLPLIADHR